MASRSFFTDDAKRRVRAAIEQIESQTSAEVVVAVRRQATSYLDLDLSFGMLAALGALLALMHTEQSFSPVWIPFDFLVAFLAGVLLSSQLPPLRRLLASRRRRHDATARATREAFLDLKVSQTTGRNGIVVLISIFEREVGVVCDIGVERTPPIRAAIERLEASIAGFNPSFDRFEAALLAIGPVLGAAMPRQEDDVNELPDDVRVS